VAFILFHIPETEPVLMSGSIHSEDLHSQIFSGSYTADANDSVATAICMIAVEILLMMGVLEGTERSWFLGACKFIKELNLNPLICWDTANMNMT
jgi:hypothetical protein